MEVSGSSKITKCSLLEKQAETLVATSTSKQKRRKDIAEMMIQTGIHQSRQRFGMQVAKQGGPRTGISINQAIMS